MTAVPARPLWQIGRDNFNHGAATYREHRRFQELKDSNLNELHCGLQLDPKKPKSKAWSREELEKLWYLRWEHKPRLNYDQLAVRFGNLDTQVIVDALTELRHRREAEIEDIYKPFGEDDAFLSIKKERTKPKPLPKPKTKLLMMPSEPKVHEKTKQMVIYRGMGLSLTQIANEMGIKVSTVTTNIARVRKRHPGLYNDLLEKGRNAKK